jgi:protein TonB
MVAEKEAPVASFGVAGSDFGGANGAMGSLFGDAAKTQVKAAPPKVVKISSGVMQGMVLLKTQPIYPPIAKAARVQGVVVLQATISKTGSITDLRVVSGPAMLQSAALDAVKSWRYKPYLLNNEPVEVETQVNVIFTLGG